MSKKSNQRYQTPPKQPVKTSQPSNRPPQASVTEVVKQAAGQALKHAGEDDLAKIGEIRIPENLNPTELADLFRQMDEARQLFCIQMDKLTLQMQEIDERRAALATKESNLTEQDQQLKTREADIEQRSRAVDEKQTALNAQSLQLAQKTADLLMREENARAGFQTQFQDVHDQVARLNAETTERQIAVLKKQEEDLARLRAAQEESINTLYRQHEEQIQIEMERVRSMREKLNDERQQLDVEVASARSERKQFERDMKLLEEERNSFDEIVARQVTKDTTRLQDELNYYKDRFNEANTDRLKYQQLLIKWDAVARRVGKDTESIPKFIDELEKQVSDLKSEIEKRPSVQALEKIAYLEQEKADLEQERTRLGRELEEKRHLLNGVRIGAIELEDLYKLNAALEASRKELKAELESIKDEIEKRLEKGDGSKSPFPQCFTFDHDRNLTSEPPTTKVTDLKQFAEEVQMRIANPVYERPGLFYRIQDIRSFIGGLAMSKMMILQGISGTGKTSLAVAFAEVVGGGREIIEVQAGWRDRDDLIGHYNSFEKKFYETKFLQALYQAQCPLYKDRIFIILLDELNLSYPEQYFADLLSALQMKERADRKIDLIPQAPANRPYPRLFINDNRSILIPDNVWFIGTANRDETTKDIADKTYDRSHILELPNQHPPMQTGPVTTSASFVSVTELQSFFSRSQKDPKYQKDVTAAWEFLEHVQPTFSELGIGWGNRMKGQLEMYLPVVVACGGKWYEAADDLFATKILRKIRDRYEILPEDITRLRLTMDKAWKLTSTSISVEDAFDRSIRIIEDEDMKKDRMRAEQA